MRDGPDDRTDSRKHHRDASAPPARSIPGESRASELSGISGTSGASGGGATPGLQPQNRQRENLRKVLPFALERKTGLALALRASGSRILADTPGPWKGRFEVAGAESLMHRHTKQKGKNLLDSSLLFWSGKRDSHSHSHSHLRCARAFPRILTDIPGPWKGRFEVACAEFLMHRHTKAKGRIPEDSPFCFGLGNGFPAQTYSLSTISALREAFSTKVTPAMRSSCTCLHPNAFDKDNGKLHLIQAKMGMVLFFECGG